MSIIPEETFYAIAAMIFIAGAAVFALGYGVACLVSAL